MRLGLNNPLSFSQSTFCLFFRGLLRTQAQQRSAAPSRSQCLTPAGKAWGLRGRARSSLWLGCLSPACGLGRSGGGGLSRSLGISPGSLDWGSMSGGGQSVAITPLTVSCSKDRMCTSQGWPAEGIAEPEMGGLGSLGNWGNLGLTARQAWQEAWPETLARPIITLTT